MMQGSLWRKSQRILSLVVISGLAVLACSDSSKDSSNQPTYPGQLGQGGTTGTSGSSGSSTNQGEGGKTAGYQAANAAESLLKSDLDAVRASVKLFYGHLSHGAQLMNGFDMLASLEPDRFGVPAKWITEFDSSLDPRPEYPEWSQATREQLLKADNDRNVVLWAWSSWLTKADKVNEAFIQTNYLDKMAALEQEFPKVVFVYATGPKDAASTGTKHNAMIRNYAQENGKFLYDFESVEAFDPDGKFYPQATDKCDWCESWCASHSCPTVSSSCSACGTACMQCQEWNHTHCFNCYRKGLALWHLLHSIAGQIP
jgi:hypothetical protein